MNLKAVNYFHKTLQGSECASEREVLSRASLQNFKAFIFQINSGRFYEKHSYEYRDFQIQMFSGLRLGAAIHSL